jgi:uncharacterized membrane protein YecN with MAPEG domain
MNLLLLPPKITIFYTGFFGVFYFLLSVNVIRNRWLEKKGLGHDVNPKSGLFKAVRIHGNFMEYVPLLLLLMALDEMTIRGGTYLHAIGISLFMARLFHYFGISKTHLVSWQRSAGVCITFLVLLSLSINLIIKGVS